MASPTPLPLRWLVRGRLVLIYQMPKIGSQTIEATLQRWKFPHPIRRFHYLSPVLAGTLLHGLSAGTSDPTWRREAQQQLQWIREITRMLRWRRLLCALGLKIPKLEVITGVRDLIGLALSSMFENYLYFAPSPESMNPERCREVLLRPTMFKWLRHWFDLELKPFLRIDVFQSPFEYEQGYCLLENRFARVLLYRFEALNRLPGLLQNFLGHEIPALAEANLGSAKPYAAHYAHARHNVRLPTDFVRSLYEDKMMRHFYSESERAALGEKWGEQGAAPPQKRS